MKRMLSGLMVCALALPALAEPMETSPRPKARPAAETPPTAEAPVTGEVLASGEVLYTGEPLPTGEYLPAAEVLSLSTLSPNRPPRPLQRPDGLVQKAMAQREREGSGLCGSPGIVGDYVGTVPGRLPGCGIEDAVKVRSVSGVKLSQPSLMNCGAARVLNGWARNGLREAVGRMGGGVAGLRVAAHYACRTRNNQPGAKISEHGKGKAIDISQIRLQSGDTLNVLRDWGKGEKGRALRRIRDSACGPFGTVLGPGSDGFHRDHFHFDAAARRNSAVCR